MVLWLAALGPLAIIGRLGIARLVTAVAAAAPARLDTLVRIYLATALIWALKLTAFAILLQHVVPVDSWRVLAGAVNLHLFLLGVTLTLALLAPLLPGRPARSAATSTQPTEAPG
jgi:hypothetical protein